MLLLSSHAATRLVSRLPVCCFSLQSFFLRQHNSLNFVDSSVIYKSKSTKELAMSLAIFKLSSSKFLVRNSRRLINTSYLLFGHHLTDFLVYHTMFKQFCAGRNVQEVQKTMELLSSQRIGVILDYAAESDVKKKRWYKKRKRIESEREKYDHNAHSICESTEVACSTPEAFVSLKMSAIASPDLLIYLSERAASDSDSSLRDDAQQEQTKQAELNALQARLDLIVRLLIDAEQSYFQQGIDSLALSLMEVHNTSSCLIYNTLQAYLSTAFNTLSCHLDQATAKKFLYGCKLVRGAYMSLERRLAKSRGVSSPICDNMNDTHQSFHNCADLMLDHPERCTVMLATHNKDSIQHVVSRFPTLSSHLLFGQLFGMADYITVPVANMGYQSYKYLPYGPVREVIPYLLRRAEENVDILARTSFERMLIRSELKRRLFRRRRCVKSTA